MDSEEGQLSRGDLLQVRNAMLAALRLKDAKTLSFGGYHVN